MLATNCLLLQFEYLKRTLFLEVKVDLSLGFWQAVSTSQTIDYRIILITVPSWITVHRSASPEQGKPSVKESARSRFFFAANRRGLTAGDFFTLFLSAMGNTSSKTATTNLSSKDLALLREKIIKEYPWLQDVEESMLITDMRLPDCPIVFANNDFHEMTQYSHEEVIGFNCRFLQGKHTNPRTVDKIREAVKTGKEIEVDILNYRKDGTPFLNNFLMVPLHAKKNRPALVTHFLAVQKDVTYLLEDDDPSGWHSAQIALWLERAGYGEYAGPFIEHEVSGAQFLEMNASRLRKIGIVDRTVQIRLVRLIQQLASQGPSFIPTLGRSKVESGPDPKSDSLWDEHSNKGDTFPRAIDTQSSSDLASANSNGVYMAVNLHQPRQAAYWRRKKLLDDDFQVLEGDGKEVDAIPLDILLRFVLFHVERQEEIGTPQEMQISCHSLLYHVKRAIRGILLLESSIFLLMNVDGTWQRITSQQNFRKYLAQGKNAPYRNHS